MWNLDWNFYASFNSNKSLENVSMRVGACHIHPNCNNDMRLKMERKSLTFYNRTVTKYGKTNFGALVAYNITNNILVKNNLLLGYKIDDKSTAYLRLENNGFRSTKFDWSNWQGYFDSVKLDFVSSYKDIKYGFQVLFLLFREY